MSKRPQTVALVAFGAILVQGCAHDLGKHCSYSKSLSLATADSESLGIVVGAPADSLGDKPFVMLHTPSQEDQEMALQLNLVPASILWPNSLDESRCRGLVWRTYRVKTDSEQWKAFWGRPRPLAIEFELAVFKDSLDSKSFSLPFRSFAVAWVDATTGEPIQWCGCYRT